MNQYFLFATSRDIPEAAISSMHQSRKEADDKRNQIISMIESIYGECQVKELHDKDKKPYYRLTTRYHGSKRVFFRHYKMNVFDSDHR